MALSPPKLPKAINAEKVADAIINAPTEEKVIQLRILYRRVVLLCNAKASVTRMARPWGVVIRGTIGANTLRILETFTNPQDAVKRSKSVNKKGFAVVASVEEILFPTGVTVGHFNPEREEKEVDLEKLRSQRTAKLKLLRISQSQSQSDAQDDTQGGEEE